MTDNKNKNDTYEYIDVSPLDLYITNLYNEYQLMKQQGFLPMIIGKNDKKENVYVYQYDVYRNAVLGIRCALDKLIVKRDFFFSASSNLTSILQCKGNKELFIGCYDNGNRFAVFARKIVKNEIDLFTQKKEKYKKIVDSLDGYSNEEK